MQCVIDIRRRLIFRFVIRRNLWLFTSRALRKGEERSVLSLRQCSGLKISKSSMLLLKRLFIETCRTDLAKLVSRTWVWRDQPLMVSRGHKCARSLDLGRDLRNLYWRFRKNQSSEQNGTGYYYSWQLRNNRSNV